MWMLAGLCVAFASSVASVVWLWTLWGLVDPGTRLLAATLFVLAPVAAVAAACAGLVGLRHGREELGPAHARDVRWAFLTLLPEAAASAVLFFASGLVLGSVYVPASPAGLLGLTPRAALVGIHDVAGLLLAVFAGLFLLWIVRSLGAPETIVLAGATIALGVLSALENVFLVDVGLAPWFLSAASLGIWVFVYAVTLHRLRGMPRASGAKPIAA